MVRSGPEGVSWADMAAFLSMVLQHSLPVCWSDCPCYRGSHVPVPENTPLLELISAAHADSASPLPLVSIFNHQPALSLLWREQVRHTYVIHI